MASLGSMLGGALAAITGQREGPSASQTVPSTSSSSTQASAKSGSSIANGGVHGGRSGNPNPNSSPGSTNDGALSRSEGRGRQRPTAEQVPATSPTTGVAKGDYIRPKVQPGFSSSKVMPSPAGSAGTATARPLPSAGAEPSRASGSGASTQATASTRRTAAGLSNGGFSDTISTNGPTKLGMVSPGRGRSAGRVAPAPVLEGTRGGDGTRALSGDPGKERDRGASNSRRGKSAGPRDGPEVERPSSRAASASRPMSAAAASAASSAGQGVVSAAAAAAAAVQAASAAFSPVASAVTASVTKRLRSMSRGRNPAAVAPVNDSDEEPSGPIPRPSAAGTSVHHTPSGGAGPASVRTQAHRFDGPDDADMSAAVSAEASGPGAADMTGSTRRQLFGTGGSAILRSSLSSNALLGKAMSRLQSTAAAAAAAATTLVEAAARATALPTYDFSTSSGSDASSSDDDDGTQTEAEAGAGGARKDERARSLEQYRSPSAHDAVAGRAGLEGSRRRDGRKARRRGSLREGSPDAEGDGDDDDGAADGQPVPRSSKPKARRESHLTPSWHKGQDDGDDHPEGKDDGVDGHGDDTTGQRGHGARGKLDKDRTSSSIRPQSSAKAKGRGKGKAGASGAETSAVPFEASDAPWSPQQQRMAAMGIAAGSSPTGKPAARPVSASARVRFDATGASGEAGLRGSIVEDDGPPLDTYTATRARAEAVEAGRQKAFDMYVKQSQEERAARALKAQLTPSWRQPGMFAYGRRDSTGPEGAAVAAASGAGPAATEGQKGRVSSHHGDFDGPVLDHSTLSNVCGDCAAVGPGAYPVLASACGYGHEHCLKAVMAALNGAKLGPASTAGQGKTATVNAVELADGPQNVSGAFRYKAKTQGNKIAPTPMPMPVDGPGPGAAGAGDGNTAAAGKAAPDLSLLRNLDARGRTLLHLAAASGDASIVLTLLQSGLSASAVDATGAIPLHVAAEHDADGCVLALLDADFDGLEAQTLQQSDAAVLGGGRGTPAANTGAAAVYSGAGGVLGAASSSAGGETPLHCAARAGAEKAALALLQSAANTGARDGFGRTPLHLAATGSIAKMLLAHGADPSTKDNRGWLPVHHAAGGYAAVDALTLLLDTDALAAMGGGAGAGRAARAITAGKGADAFRPWKARTQDGTERTPLHLAASAGRTDCIAVLLLAGAEVQAKDNNGRTPLDLAWSAQQVGAIAVLEAAVKHGGRPMSAARHAANVAAEHQVSPGRPSPGTPGATAVDAATPGGKGPATRLNFNRGPGSPGPSPQNATSPGAAGKGTRTDAAGRADTAMANAVGLDDSLREPAPFRSFEEVTAGDADDTDGGNGAGAAGMASPGPQSQAQTQAHSQHASQPQDEAARREAILRRKKEEAEKARLAAIKKKELALKAKTAALDRQKAAESAADEERLRALLQASPPKATTGAVAARAANGSFYKSSTAAASSAGYEANIGGEEGEDDAVDLESMKRALREARARKGFAPTAAAGSGDGGRADATVTAHAVASAAAEAAPATVAEPVPAPAAIDVAPATAPAMTAAQWAAAEQEKYRRMALEQQQQQLQAKQQVLPVQEPAPQLQAEQTPQPPPEQASEQYKQQEEDGPSQQNAIEQAHSAAEAEAAASHAQPSAEPGVAAPAAAPAGRPPRHGVATTLVQIRSKSDSAEGKADADAGGDGAGPDDDGSVVLPGTAEEGKEEGEADGPAAAAPAAVTVPPTAAPARPASALAPADSFTIPALATAGPGTSSRPNSGRTTPVPASPHLDSPAALAWQGLLPDLLGGIPAAPGALTPGGTRGEGATPDNLFPPLSALTSALAAPLPAFPSSTRSSSTGRRGVEDAVHSVSAAVGSGATAVPALALPTSNRPSTAPLPPGMAAVTATGSAGSAGSGGTGAAGAAGIAISARGRGRDLTTRSSDSTQASDRVTPVDGVINASSRSHSRSRSPMKGRLQAGISPPPPVVRPPAPTVPQPGQATAGQAQTVSALLSLAPLSFEDTEQNLPQLPVVGASGSSSGDSAGGVARSLSRGHGQQAAPAQPGPAAPLPRYVTSGFGGGALSPIMETPGTSTAEFKPRFDVAMVDGKATVPHRDVPETVLASNTVAAVPVSAAEATGAGQRVPHAAEGKETDVTGTSPDSAATEPTPPRPYAPPRTPGTVRRINALDDQLEAELKAAQMLVLEKQLEDELKAMTAGLGATAPGANVSTAGGGPGSSNVTPSRRSPAGLPAGGPVLETAEADGDANDPNESSIAKMKRFDTEISITSILHTERPNTAASVGWGDGAGGPGGGAGLGHDGTGTSKGWGRSDSRDSHGKTDDDDDDDGLSGIGGLTRPSTAGYGPGPGSGTGTGTVPSVSGAAGLNGAAGAMGVLRGREPMRHEPSVASLARAEVAAMDRSGLSTALDRTDNLAGMGTGMGRGDVPIAASAGPSRPGSAGSSVTGYSRPSSRGPVGSPGGRLPSLGPLRSTSRSAMSGTGPGAPGVNMGSPGPGPASGPVYTGPGPMPMPQAFGPSGMDDQSRHLLNPARRMPGRPVSAYGPPVSSGLSSQHQKGMPSYPQSPQQSSSYQPSAMAYSRNQGLVQLEDVDSRPSSRAERALSPSMSARRDLPYQPSGPSREALSAAAAASKIDGSSLQDVIAQARAEASFNGGSGMGMGMALGGVPGMGSPQSVGRYPSMDTMAGRTPSRGRPLNTSGLNTSALNASGVLDSSCLQGPLNTSGLNQSGLLNASGLLDTSYASAGSGSTTGMGMGYGNMHGGLSRPASGKTGTSGLGVLAGYDRTPTSASNSRAPSAHSHRDHSVHGQRAPSAGPRSLPSLGQLLSPGGGAASARGSSAGPPQAQQQAGQQPSGQSQYQQYPQRPSSGKETACEPAPPQAGAQAQGDGAAQTAQAQMYQLGQPQAQGQARMEQPLPQSELMIDESGGLVMGAPRPRDEAEADGADEAEAGAGAEAAEGKENCDGDGEGKRGGTGPGGGPVFIEEQTEYPSHGNSSSKTSATAGAAGHGQKQDKPMGRPKRRRLVQNYPALVQAYRAQEPYRAAARGHIPMTCTMCHEAPVRRAFLPCEHAAVCDSCIIETGIGPASSGKAKGKGGKAGGSTAAALQGMFNSCPVCLGTILAVVPVGTTGDDRLQARVEEAMVHAMAGGGPGAGPGGIGQRFDPANAGVGDTRDAATGSGALPPRFRTLFSRSARSLEDWLARKQAMAARTGRAVSTGRAGDGSHPGSGAGPRIPPPTSSDLARAGWRPDFGPESALAVRDARGLLDNEPGGAWYSDFEED